MLAVKRGNIFKSNAQTLVNTVNCVGVMGKGIALGFRKRFPEVYEDYVQRCERGEVRLGRPYLYRRSTEPWVLNFPTKDHWRSLSSLDDIIEGLEYLKRHYEEWGVTSLAVPPLGCGHGQLEWRVVGPTLFRHLGHLDIPVELYAPHDAPDEQVQLSFLDEPTESDPDDDLRIPAAWIALVDILARLEREPYSRPIGRIGFQKLAYFATAEGIPTDLTYQRGSYGPYAEGMKRVASQLINNGLLREQRRGRMFQFHVGPTYQDALESYAPALAAWETKIERLADLLSRMNGKQAEIAATVHFASHQLLEKNADADECAVLHEVMNWKQKRRPPVDSTEVASTIRHLNMLGWLGVRSCAELPVSEDDLLPV